MISTSKRHAKQPFAGGNTQHITSQVLLRSFLETMCRSSMSMPFQSASDAMPPDFKELEQPQQLDCPVPPQSCKRNSLFELSSLAYADEIEGEDESIILVTEEEEGRDPLWTLVSKIKKPEASFKSGQEVTTGATTADSGPVSFITGIRMTHGQSPINHPSVPIR